MARRGRIAFTLTLPVCLLALLVGCSGSGDGDNENIASRKPRKKPGAGGAIALSPVVATGTTTLKGRVTLKPGKDPDYSGLTATLQAEINKMEKDRTFCLMASPEEVSQSMWVVDKGSRGVKNVFVWLRPEDDTKQYFDVTELVKANKFRPAVTLDQPHCAFLPHAEVIFPSYIDPKDPKGEEGVVRTPQKFIVKNSAPIAHNTRWSGDSTSGGNSGLSPNAGSKVDSLEIKNIEPSYKYDVSLSCSVHPWMKAYVWAFPHPFAAVTNDKGEFTIENAPAGVNVRLVAWHEGGKWVNGGEKGTTLKLDAGQHQADLAFDYGQ